MKICIVSPGAYPLFSSDGGETAGGAETQLYTLAREFARRGYDVHFITGDFGQQQIERSGNVTLHKSALRYMGGSNFFLLPDWINFLRLLWRIDARIHLIKVPRNLLLPLSFYARIRSRRSIFIGQRDVDTTRDGILENDNRLAYWFYRIGLFMAHGVVAQTEFQKKLFMKNFSKRATVIRNVLTLENNEQEDKADYLLWVGNSSYRKQPELVLELAKRLPEYRIKMIMSLIGERSSDEFITTASVDLPNLEYVGFVPFKDIASYYSRARLLVGTSKSEGFPNIYLQAWQCGTPVASLHIDPDGVIAKHDLGFVSGSMDQLVADIKELMSDRERLVKMGQNAVDYVEKFHSLQKSADAYEELFADLGFCRQQDTSG